MKTIFLFSIALLILVLTFLKVKINLLAIIFLISIFVYISKKISLKCCLFCIVFSLFFYLFPLYEIDTNFINIDFSLFSINKETREYIKLFLFNEKQNSSIYGLSNKLGISYLIVISGLHFNLIYNYLNKVINYFFDENITSFIIFSFLFLYLLILDFSISALRAFLMLLIGKINKMKFQKYLSNLDIYLLTIIIVTLLFPKSIFSYSYIYSFTLTFFIVIIQKFTNLNLLKLSIFSFLVSLPITIKLNNSVNLASPLFSFVLTTPFMIAIFLSFLIIIFPFLDFLGLYFKGLESFCHLLNKLSFYITLDSVDNMVIIAYYLILLLVVFEIEKKNIKNVIIKISSLLVMLSLIFIKQYIENPYQITFLNVYQGDCIVFTSKYSSYAYLVDCGGNKNIDIASKIIIPFLEKKNIKKIKFFIKTHNDYDHIGALDSLKEKIHIEYIYEEGNRFCFFSFCLDNINNKDYNNDNDNSIVLYGSYNNMKIFLSGDISSKVEKDIIEKYPTLKIDILKVAHHGSKYSTSQKFVNQYKPKVSIINYGYNYYGHPHLSVISRLNSVNSRIFSTFEDGHITIRNKNNRIIITFSKRKKVQIIAM